MRGHQALREDYPHLETILQVWLLTLLPADLGGGQVEEGGCGSEAIASHECWVEGKAS